MRINAYAVIIGIDSYQNPAWELKSAVQDALKFASWALREGGVTQESIRLLLSPTQAITNPLLIPGINSTLSVSEATTSNLRKILYDEFRDANWGSSGDRLYFYFAGHGCSHPQVRGEKRNEPVLIFNDVAKLPRDYHLLFTFSDILELLRGCGPTEQYFFLDACRDFALDGILGSSGTGTGRYMRPITQSTGKNFSNQYVIYATSPGDRAIEIGKGVFSNALLKGLNGCPETLQRNTGIGIYELSFTKLFDFVKKSVQRQIKYCGKDITEYIQIPEQESEPSSPNPIIRIFDEKDIPDVELIVRVGPKAARNIGEIKILYGKYLEAGPVAPIPNPSKFILKPDHYIVEATAPGFSTERKPIGVPSDQPVTLALAQSFVQQPAASPKSLVFSCQDKRAVIETIDPDGCINTGLGDVNTPNPKVGIYQARILSPEGSSGNTQLFEFPQCGEFVELVPTTQNLDHEHLTQLSSAGIQPINEYLQPSESLGPMVDVKSNSLLGFAAYACYTMPEPFMSRLRSFGLQPVPEDRKSSAWFTILINAEGYGKNIVSDNLSVVDRSSVAVYLSDNHYSLGRFNTLPGFQVAGQFIQEADEGNITVELRIPELPPIRFPITCMTGRVTVLCLSLMPDQSLDAQMYMIPFAYSEMNEEALRILEQVQRFYSGSEPMPDVLIEKVLNLKTLDPLLGALAGYTLIRQGKGKRYKGQTSSILGPDEWSNSAMQNMVQHFGLLPDSHVLAALCETSESERDKHFKRALDTGIPLFLEGFQALLDHYRSKPEFLTDAMRRTRRSLATGSAFSSWIGYEPTLIVEEGRFAKPPIIWSVLERQRDRIEQSLRAVGLVRLENGKEIRNRTGFLIAPDKVLTVNHVLTGSVCLGVAGWSLNPGYKLSFVIADSIGGLGCNVLNVREVVVIDTIARLALLKLEAPVKNIEPFALPQSSTIVQQGQMIYLVGYPFLDNTIDPALIMHVFGTQLGTKRVQPGFILTAPRDKTNFDHDAFTLEGSAGSPVIDIETNKLLGVHWGSMNDGGFRRGRATALWKQENRCFSLT